MSPWLLVAEDHDLVVRTAPLRPDDVTLDVDALEALLGERTRVVAFTLASNAVGSIPDAGAIAAAAHSVGALAWADGVHFAPHRRLDARELGLDVAALLAVQVLRPAPRHRRDPAATSPSRCPPTACARPTRTRPGTASRPARSRTRRSPASTAAVDYLRDLGDGDLDAAFDARSRSTRTRSRARFLEAALPRRRRRCTASRTPHGPSARRRSASTSPARRRARSPSCSAEQGIYVWDGNYYALEPMRALGLEDTGGAVRAGFLHYTTEDEVDRLLDALGALVE